jgi:hypothetical protein
MVRAAELLPFSETIPHLNSFPEMALVQTCPWRAVQSLTVSNALSISQGPIGWLAVICSFNEGFGMIMKMTLRVMELNRGHGYLISAVPMPMGTLLAHFQCDFIPVIRTNGIAGNSAEGIVKGNPRFK